jgi:hypothetical protein
MHRSALAAFVLVACASSGCNTIAGINDPVDPPASSGSSGSSGAVDGGGATSDADRFVGTWRNTKQVTAVCGNAPQLSPQPDVPFRFQIAKSDSGIVITLASFPDCSLAFTVSGDVATAVAGQQCTFRLTNETDRYAYLPSSTFTLKTATTAELYIAANAGQVGGPTCSYEEASDYERERSTP